MNLKDWCKNDFEVINQLRINTRSSHRRYDVILLINGLPLVQVELKTLAVSPRKALRTGGALQIRPQTMAIPAPCSASMQLVRRQQPHRYVLFYQQQRRAFPLQCRRAVPARVPLGRRKKQ
ncbi:type I restriction endonuclease [Thermoflavifilum sp.]|uniref:type I restriction endonuclease n=1 Tax=Thermoflavifilum sp. TaxID=1968839 RepID=UPI00342874C8